MFIRQYLSLDLREIVVNGLKMSKAQHLAKEWVKELAKKAKK